MAFRSQTQLVALLAVVMGAAMAQELNVPVELHRSGRNVAGELQLDHEGVHFVPAHPSKLGLDLPWQDVQSLSASPHTIRVLTYEDQRWKLGRDRELTFSRREGRFRPEDALLLRRWLPAKLSLNFPVPGTKLWWSVPAKWTRGLRGRSGTVSVWNDRVTFASNEGDEGATWFDHDLIQVAKSGRYGLILTTAEPSRIFHAGERTVSFQTKEEVDDRRVDAVWRRLQRGTNLEFIADQQRPDPKDQEGNKP